MGDGQERIMLPRLLVVLDLDETLIRADAATPESGAEFVLGPYRVRRRPFAGEFIQGLQEFAEVGFWSSGTDTYVAEIAAKITPPGASIQFQWGRSRCTRRYDPERHEEYWVKDLKKIRRMGYALERTIVVDDSPEKAERNFGNYIRVPPFLGDPSDRLLPQLLAYLRMLVEVPNVRVLEKRHWLTEVARAAAMGDEGSR
jgi:RNA polymerase II subunit A small phosphatase-like protein